MASIINCLQMEEQPVTESGAKGLLYRLIFKPNSKRQLHSNYVTVSPGGNSKSHKHEWEHINYIISGYGILEYGEGKQESIAAGMAIYIPANESHCFRNTGTDDLVIFGVLGPKMP